MRKLFLPLLFSLFLLTSCAKEDARSRAAALQESLAAMEGWSAEVKVDLPCEGETLHYAFSIESGGDEATLTLTEPQTLAGVTAHLSGDALKLSYGTLVLDAGTAAEGVNGVNCVPLMLRALAEGYVLRASVEPFGGEEEALFLVCESECSGEVLNYRAYVSPLGVPLYGEIEKNQEIIAFMEFTNFTACDTMAENTDAAAPRK